MYNTKVVCTYHKDDEIFLPTDNISEEEKDLIRDSIYRQEFLNIFELDDFDEEKIEKYIYELFEKIKECKPLRECMEKAAGQFISNDKEFGLYILFSFDYMYLTNICISEYLEKNEISEISISNLLKKLI